jgi:hypothetical protein
MKPLAVLAVLAVSALVLAAFPAQAQTCLGAPATVGLVTVPGAATAGSVTVSNDATYLYVTFLTSGWTMSQLDVAKATSLGGLPLSLSSFPYRTQFNPGVTNYTFTIPLGHLAIGTKLFLAAHAAVQSPTQESQSAWGAGQPIPGSPACGSCSGGNGEHEGCGGDDQRDCDHHDGDSHHDGDHHDSLAKGGGSQDDKAHGSSGSSHGDDHKDGDHHDGDDHDGGHHGDDGHSSGGSGGSCGATYFTYVLNCNSPE